MSNDISYAQWEMLVCILRLKTHISSFFQCLISWVNPHLDGISESVNQATLSQSDCRRRRHCCRCFSLFGFYQKGSWWVPSDKDGSPSLKAPANKWICSPSRQPLIVFHRGKMQFVSFLRCTSKGRMSHCTENALFPIEGNQICTLFVRFFLHLHLFDKAVSSDGKWVDKSR